MDKDVDRRGIACYGAIGVGGTKVKIREPDLKRLFELTESSSQPR